MGNVYNEIVRLETAKSDIETAIESCGVNVPNTELIDTYASYIRQIPSAVFSGLNVDPIGGTDLFIKSIKQENGLINATTGGLVSTSLSGLVPKADDSLGNISSQENDWVLTNKNGTIDWYKLPVNAFKNDNTTYNNATSTESGLMSSTDKAKLDGIASGANKYTLPTASSSTLGGVKIGNNINISNGVISVSKAGSDALGVVKGFHHTSGSVSGTRTTNASNTPAVNNRTTTAGRYYGVETDVNGCLFVNVPWTDTNTDTDTHYITSLYIGSSESAQNSSTTNGNTYLKLFDNSTLRNQYKIQGTGLTTVTSDASGNLTIHTPTSLSWDSITGKPDSFTPSSHNHATNKITSLTGYTIATSTGSLSTSDTLNDALGKLEYKANLGKSAYDIVSAANDGDGTIENLAEILKVLEGIKDTETIQTIVGKYLPIGGGTITGNLSVNGTSTFTGNTTHKGIAYFANGTTYYINASGAAKVASITSGAISGSTGSFSGLITATGGIKTNVIQAPTSSGGSTYGTGSNGQVLRSNGSSVYWAAWPSIGNGTIKITQNGTEVGSFTTNQSGATTIDVVNTWRDITDAVDSTSSTISGSAKAVKTAYDKAVAAYNLANSKTDNVGDITGVTAGEGLSGGGTSGSVTLTNSGVRSTTINGNYLRVNTNGTNSDLTIPYASVAGSISWSNISGVPSTFSPSSHTHDGRYYTESEIDTLLDAKSDSGHNHDSRYYTATISRTANTVLAAPNGSSGVASFRKLVAADLPNHTHLYAGSSSAGGSATSAVKLDSSAGSATQPIFFSNGKPAACTYSLGKSVPSDAKFTDTNTWRPVTDSYSGTATDTSLSQKGAKSLYDTLNGKFGSYLPLAGGTCTGSIYAPAYYTTSDLNLKTNIKNITTSDNMPIIKSFDWIDTKTSSYGLIAQELEAQGYYELVSHRDDGYKTVNYEAALSLIIGKLQIKISELEKEIENLKIKKS